MKIEEVGLQYLELLNGAFKKLECGLSEYTFANIYLFRKLHQYELIFGKKIFIKGKTRDGLIYYMPTEIPTAEDFYDLSNELNDESITLFPIAEQWLTNFPKEQFSYHSLEADADYYFSLEKMRHYPGRSLSGQRNFVSQFTKLYTSKALPLNYETAQDAIKALESWHRAHADDEDSDYDSCLEAIQKHKILKLSGYVYYVDDIPAAFALGETLTSKIFVAQFIKADTQFKGIYPYVYQHFALHIENSYEILNFEQDLGIPGMKKAKQSYHPEKLVSKWRIHSTFL